MNRHGDSSWRLHAAVRREDERFIYSTILTWRRGQKAPQDALSFSILARIEHRYRLPAGYFAEKLRSAPRATRGGPVLDIAPSEMRRLAWHLPNDLRDRSLADQEEIVSWVRNVIVSGAPDYRRYQAAAMKQRYGLRFTTQLAPARTAAIDLRAADLKASRTLNSEMEALVAFKTSTLTTAGYARSGVWGAVTADQRTEHLSLLFGALMAAPDGPVRGRGIPSDKLTLALLLFPAVWDWYVQWRERRRGFYTSWEVDLLQLGIALAREKTGWLRQTPSIGTRLQPIEGLVSVSDIEAARSDWDGACDRLYAHGLARAKEIERVARVHRDPFEPILPILEADSPLGEYRKITEEIVRRMPDARRYPKAAAETVRGFLMLRVGLHTGLRQKNLRQLLVCHRTDPQRSERQLTDARRGELRWNEREAGWEVLIPSAAFKNANSSFFGNRPFRLVLPDLGGLYDTIDAYLARHRSMLLAGRSDPGTFFVKTMKVTSREAAYDQNTFYEAWRLTIQRYGIYNPYTGRGAIKGLLPHGPHNVRDVLATHILKQTGSYEQASYAIQDTPEMVAKHYGRFLPQDKAALAAQVLNKAWA
jgi:hypothetical protein